MDGSTLEAFTGSFLEEEEEGDIFFYYSFLSFPSCVYMIYICIFEIFVETKLVLFFSFVHYGALSCLEFLIDN